LAKFFNISAFFTNRGPTRMPAPYADIEVYNWGQSKAEWKANAHLRAIKNKE